MSDKDRNVKIQEKYMKKFGEDLPLKAAELLVQEINEKNDGSLMMDLNGLSKRTAQVIMQTTIEEMEKDFGNKIGSDNGSMAQERIFIFFYGYKKDKDKKNEIVAKELMRFVQSLKR